MPNYLRPQVTGATIFFTVALAERQSDLLTHEVNRLRQAVRDTDSAHPLTSRPGSSCPITCIASGGFPQETMTSRPAGA